MTSRTRDTITGGFVSTILKMDTTVLGALVLKRSKLFAVHVGWQEKILSVRIEAGPAKEVA
jgi:hypothetical protein